MERSLRAQQDAAYAESAKKDAQAEQEKRNKKRKREEESLDTWLHALTKVRSCIDKEHSTYRDLATVKYYWPQLSNKPEGIISDEEWERLTGDVNKWFDAQRRRPTNTDKQFQRVCGSPRRCDGSPCPQGDAGHVEEQSSTLQEQISHVCGDTNRREEGDHAIRGDASRAGVSSDHNASTDSTHVHDTKTIPTSPRHARAQDTP